MLLGFGSESSASVCGQEASVSKSNNEMDMLRSVLGLMVAAQLGHHVALPQLSTVLLTGLGDSVFSNLPEDAGRLEENSMRLMLALIPLSLSQEELVNVNRFIFKLSNIYKRTKIACNYSDTNLGS